jgi:hypothetical protein
VRHELKFHFGGPSKRWLDGWREDLQVKARIECEWKVDLELASVGQLEFGKGAVLMLRHPTLSFQVTLFYKERLKPADPGFCRRRLIGGIRQLLAWHSNGAARTSRDTATNTYPPEHIRFTNILRTTRENHLPHQILTPDAHSDSIHRFLSLM